MRRILLFLAKTINRLFGYSYQDYRYFETWKYIYGISLQGMGRLQGNPVEESGEVDVLRKILRDTGEKAVIFDVGANKGQYSLHIMKEAAATNTTLSLHIFEPSHINVPILKDLFNSTRYPHHYFAINECALSDTNSIEYLYTDEKGSDLSSLLNLKIPIRPFDDSKKEKVETKKLDDYFQHAGIEKIDLLKIDVEGAEFKVLTGAMQVIAEKRIKNIQFEFGAGNITARIYFYDFWNLLSSRYHFYQVLSGGLVLILKYSTDLEIFTATNFLLILK